MQTNFDTTTLQRVGYETPNFNRQTSEKLQASSFNDGLTRIPLIGTKPGVRELEVSVGFITEPRWEQWENAIWGMLAVAAVAALVLSFILL